MEYSFLFFHPGIICRNFKRCDFNLVQRDPAELHIYFETLFLILYFISDVISETLVLNNLESDDMLDPFFKTLYIEKATTAAPKIEVDIEMFLGV